MLEISWNVVIPVAVVTAFLAAASGAVFVWAVWPWTKGRKTSEWMLLAFMATTPGMMGAAALAAIGQKPGDLAAALACFALWTSQLCFMFCGLPILDWMLARERRAGERGRELEAIGDDEG